MAIDSGNSATFAALDDLDLQQRIQLFLESRHTPEFRNLQVDVDRGVVRISGTIDSVHDREKALHVCRRVAGVIQLIDAIEIAPAETILPARTSPR